MSWMFLKYMSFLDLQVFEKKNKNDNIIEHNIKKKPAV